MTNESLTKSEILGLRLSEIRDDFSHALPQLLVGVDELIRIAEANNLAIATTNLSGYVWGRESALMKFCEIFNPILETIAPYRSNVWYELAGNQLVLPIKASVLKKEGVIVAEKLENAAADLERLLEQRPDLMLEIRCNGESLRLAASVIRIIIANSSVDKISWCKSCFRRSMPNFDYCHLHYSAEFKSQDTANRRAQRTAKSLDSELVKKWERHRIRRRIAGDQINFISVDMPIPEIQVDDSFLMVTLDAIHIVNITRNSPWTDASVLWNEIINLDFLQNLRGKLDIPSTFESWEGFVTALYIALEDPIESTFHPLWVLYIIGEAEDWFAAENKFSDRRRTGTREKVVELHRQGMSSSNVASSLAVGKKYVVKILREEGFPV